MRYQPKNIVSYTVDIHAPIYLYFVEQICFALSQHTHLFAYHISNIYISQQKSPNLPSSSCYAEILALIPKTSCVSTALCQATKLHLLEWLVILEPK